MTCDQRIAIAHLFTVFIRVDGIIDEEEISFLNELTQKYSISQEHKIKAQEISFSSAVSMLDNCECKAELITDCRKLCMIDGNSSPREALLLLALQYRLNKETADYCALTSIETNYLTFKEQYVIYVESEYDEELNAYIGQNIESIHSTFKLAGFDFIYIPQFVQDFRAMPQKYMCNVLSYISPRLHESEITTIYQHICSLTSQKFCKDYLSDTMSYYGIRETDPALIINVGYSTLTPALPDGKSRFFSEILRIDIQNTFKEEMKNFLESYKHLSGYNPSVIYPNKEHSFKYFGFYKTLYDIFLFRKQQDSRMVIDTLHRVIRYPEVGAELHLPPKRMALYLLIIRQTLCGKDGALYVHYPTEAHRKKIDNIFRQIYINWLDGSEEEEEIRFDTHLSQNLSKLKREIISALSAFPHLHPRLPRKEGDYWVVDLPSESTFVTDADGKEVLLSQCEKWKTLGK